MKSMTRKMSKNLEILKLNFKINNSTSKKVTMVSYFLLFFCLLFCSSIVLEN